ncbi:YncE family protein [Chryseobacterium zhengzhouense]|uniref:YncE family protein n=1 Tax=Chryseobacterium zhengzhouense TaxID=1636086 RepID=A0ABW2M166_9FLAO
MKLNKLLQIIFGFVLLFSVSCTSDYEEIIPEITYNNGLFITNEGKYGTPNADVSFVSRDLSVMQNDIYKAKNNNENLGDVLQTMVFNGDKAYLLLNNSNKIVIVDRTTFRKTGEITAQLNTPRYMAIANGNLYVSNDLYGGAKFVNVYKLADNSFVKKIDFASTSTVENVVEAGGNIFVQNATVGFGNTITKINTTSNTIDGAAIAVPNGNINKTISYNNNVYVIAAGTTDSYIHQISATGSVVKTTTLTGIANGTNLQIDGGRFYFSSKNKVYSMDMNATTAPTSPIITAVDGGDYFTLYGFNVIEGRIFTVDVKGFTEASEITVYTTAGTQISKFKTGIGANGVYKNY